MTLEEFVSLPAEQIRKSERLMQLFVDFYEAAFSFKPKCAGCAFKKGFKKLRQYSTNGVKKIVKFETMETKTFQLKKAYKSKILTYKKDGVTYRKYGHAITEEFAKELVASGQTDFFDVLPKVGKAKGADVVIVSKEDLDVFPVTVDYNSMDYRSELIPLYNNISEATGKEAKSRKKDDVIAFLKQNEG